MLENSGFEERFFYHSFPRRGVVIEEIDRGCQILTAIRDFGLLLVPQLIEWSLPSAGGAPPRIFPVLQRRVCFTELSPGELPGHAEKFGRFALEFETDVLRSLGAVPVFYVPQPSSNPSDGSAIGTSLLAIAMDSHAVLFRLAYLNDLLNGSTPVPEKIPLNVGFVRTPDGRGDFILDRDETKNILAAIGHGATPWSDLATGAQALLNFFAPTDDTKRGEALGYYREREWRIACNFAINGKSVLQAMKPEAKAQILAIDSEFFGRKIQTDTGLVDTLDSALLHPGLDAKPLIGMVRRVIVPAEAVKRVTKILATLDRPPPVVAVDMCVA